MPMHVACMLAAGLLHLVPLNVAGTLVSLTLLAAAFNAPQSRLSICSCPPASVSTI